MSKCCLIDALFRRYRFPEYSLNVPKNAKKLPLVPAVKAFLRGRVSKYEDTHV
jgi:hypothetical protein